MIEAVLFDGDQTLWDFEQVMRDALIAVGRRAAGGPAGPVTDALAWADLQRTGGRGGRSSKGSSTTWPGCACSGSPARSSACGGAEGGDRRRVGRRAGRGTDGLVLRTPRPGPGALRRHGARASTPCGPTTGWACSPTGAGCPRRSGWAASSSRSSSRRTTGWPSPTRASSRSSSASSGWVPRPASSSATTRSTTSPARSVPVGAPSGSTATATAPSCPRRVRRTARRRHHLADASCPRCSRPGRRRPSQRVRITTPAFAPRPTVCDSAVRAPSTWRAPHSPRSWRTSSTTWPSADAPSGSPLESRPPLGLTGRRPPSWVAPDSRSAAEPPGSHRPSSSQEPSSRAASVSWHSTTSRSCGPKPASS